MDLVAIILRQMNIFRTKFGISTVAVISGHPRYDRTASLIMDSLSAQSKESLQFVGVIGDKYSNKLSHSYSSSAILDHEEVQITRNYRQEIQDSGLNPYRALTHYKNNQLLTKLQSSNFYEDLHSKRVKAVITVGNFSLMRRLFINVTNEFNEKNAIKPLRLSFDLMKAYHKIDNEEYLDYLYCNLPRMPESQIKYEFPSICVGYEGLFKAFQFLNQYKTEGARDSFLSKDFSYEVSQLVAKARQQYRTSKGINNDHYLTLLAPGDNVNEIQFCFKVFGESLKKFAAKPEIAGIDKQFFKVLVLLPEDEEIAAKIQSAASTLPNNFEVSFVQPKDKYAAMCASDFALMHNGEATVEAAACQLPATVVSNMPNWKAYLYYLYNGHVSPINVSTNYQGYVDLMGSSAANDQKISTLMVEHFERPKLRYYYVKLYREEIQKMLMVSGHNPQLNVNKTGLTIAAEDILTKMKLHSKLSANQSRYARKQKLNVV